MVYLDNAATSFPKPFGVANEVERCLRTYCGNPGRGSHTLALRAAEKIYECRETLANFFGSSHPECLTFSPNATTAINTVIKGVLHDGDHVLISDMEHNAVLRPIHKLATAGKITYDVFPTYAAALGADTKDILSGIEARIRPNTRLLIAAHASNICSFSLPLFDIGALCRRHGILFCVDAAQSAGHLPIDAERMQIDALCFPSHKGLWGPQGCGGILWNEDVYADTLVEGGSGYHSLDPLMPEELPERHEAGTLPTPAIAGLLEGVRTLCSYGIDRIHTHVASLNTRLTRHLQSMDGVTVYAPWHTGTVLLFSADGIPADALGNALNDQGFCVRSGYHCAPLAHRTLGTPEGGAVRVSPSFYTTGAEIDRFALALKGILYRQI